MSHSLLLSLVFLGAVSATHAQNRAPVSATQRNTGERVSPLPGVTLPTAVGQAKAEPLPPPLPVRPNGVLPMPAVPRGSVSVGALDSEQVVRPARRPASPAQPAKKRP